MTITNDSSSSTVSTTAVSNRVYADLLVGLTPLLAGATATWWLFGPPLTYLLYALTLYALQGVWIVRNLPSELPGSGLGTANRLTLWRSTLLMPVAALALHPEPLENPSYWWIIVVSTVAMMLDGLDGWLARRTSTCTAFGARFDMELDALLLLALSALVWLSGKTGFWVLLVGALRYLFVASGWVWPKLRRTLEPSLRRKTACVVQGVGLLFCLAPVVPSAAASPAAAAALGLLIYSFAVDILWLLGSSRKTNAAA